MRNIRQHPVTKDEMLKALERAMETELRYSAIGAIWPAAIAEIRKRVLEADFEPAVAAPTLEPVEVAAPFVKKLVERHNSLFRSDDVNSLEEQRARQQAIQESEIMFRQIETTLLSRRAV